tara:strand:+ start:214 stop:393 length:180 start_codon:yes stop_codon:yes gene_type:complete
MRDKEGQCSGFGNEIQEAERQRFVVKRKQGNASQCPGIATFLTSGAFTIRASCKNFDAF